MVMVPVTADTQARMHDLLARMDGDPERLFSILTR
jgi:hypothetical protein